MIPNAWHFSFKVEFCVYGAIFRFGVSVAHTLIGRYKVRKHRAMDEKQLLWNRYEMHIDLYKKYMDIVLKINLFYYGITGALLSFYFTKNGNGSTIEYSLLLPIFFSGALIALFFFAEKALKVSQKDLNSLIKQLGFSYYVRTDALNYIMRGSICFIGLTTISLIFVFFSNTL